MLIFCPFPFCYNQADDVLLCNFALWLPSLQHPSHLLTGIEGFRDVLFYLYLVKASWKFISWKSDCGTELQPWIHIGSFFIVELYGQIKEHDCINLSFLASQVYMFVHHWKQCFKLKESFFDLARQFLCELSLRQESSPCGFKIRLNKVFCFIINQEQIV